MAEFDESIIATPSELAPPNLAGQLGVGIWRPMLRPPLKPAARCRPFVVSPIEALDLTTMTQPMLVQYLRSRES
ncbi:hypothetical protein LOC67_16110 [Stieleria sp. JC731]|uniref:hypothetical protein n=1 Tax=Pirellulaceae TaxID=2691357 RepID=UPI001E5335F5|nr:hypothetical protein [Stieleria sp. JC731]MCC9602087.1 hypothetical protein [Stieleria sp. JC731]